MLTSEKETVPALNIADAIEDSRILTIFKTHELPIFDTHASIQIDHADGIHIEHICKHELAMVLYNLNII